jgi:hypothetical protein
MITQLHIFQKPAKQFFDIFSKASGLCFSKIVPPKHEVLVTEFFVHLFSYLGLG